MVIFHRDVYSGYYIRVVARGNARARFNARGGPSHRGRPTHTRAATAVSVVVRTPPSNDHFSRCRGGGTGAAPSLPEVTVAIECAILFEKLISVRARTRVLLDRPSVFRRKKKIINIRIFQNVHRTFRSYGDATMMMMIARRTIGSADHTAIVGRHRLHGRRRVSCRVSVQDPRTRPVYTHMFSTCPRPFFGVCLPQFAFYIIIHLHFPICI